MENEHNNEQSTLPEEEKQNKSQSPLGVVGFVTSLFSLLLFFMSSYNSLLLPIAGVALSLAGSFSKDRAKSLAMVGILLSVATLVLTIVFNNLSSSQGAGSMPSEFDFSGSGSQFNFGSEAFDLQIDRFNFN